MPIVVKCSACGYELYRGDEPKTISEVVNMWGGRCPCCLSPLSTLPEHVQVRPIEDKERKSEEKRRSREKKNHETGKVPEEVYTTLLREFLSYIMSRWREMAYIDNPDCARFEPYTVMEQIYQRNEELKKHFNSPTSMYLKTWRQIMKSIEKMGMKVTRRRTGKRRAITWEICRDRTNDKT